MNTRYEKIDYYSDTNHLSNGTMIIWYIVRGQVSGVTVSKKYRH